MSDILGGPENIERCKDNILFVGRTENLYHDFIMMQEKMKLNLYLTLNSEYANKRPVFIDLKNNLKDFQKTEGYWKLNEYLIKDYEIIGKLYEIGKLP